MAPADTLLREWMGAMGLTSYRQLAHCAGVSLALVTRLRQRQAHLILPVKLAALAAALNRTPLDLLHHFSLLTWGNPALEAEYQRLHQQLREQPQRLSAQFQEETYRALEGLLIQYPTAQYLAQQAPHWPARQMVPLFLPISQLLEQWQISAIGIVGEQVAFDPQIHQAGESFQPSEPVYIRFVGYRTPERLLQRAKVSRTPPPLPGPPAN
ncbi:helix-turn-helix domain-containing protein [Anthocerotibacter panamensis]|uniref:helix-turn-helix domain-containing protein n=1 Tax=Anthocerotibacter panamensis TaxID=2857077 RepID=UPI001C40538A|nr:helix-turn-helix domain-containing protein [Anthocerotibacter panamensis]